MSAVDEVRAAIRVLELQRDEPQPPYFTRWNDEDFSDDSYDAIVEDAFDYGQRYGEWKEGRHLIEPQLDFLRFQLQGFPRETDEPLVDEFGLNLARGINGTTTS